MAVTDTGVSASQFEGADRRSLSTKLYRALSWCIVVTMFAFLLNDYLNFWLGWPGVPDLFANFGLFGLEPLVKPLPDTAVTLATIQLASYILALALALYYVFAMEAVGLREDAARLTAIAAYIARAAFWSVLLIGLADAAVSFMRVESFLQPLFGLQFANDMEQPQLRGLYIHLPLIALSMLIAALTRGLGFIWLALLVVLAEFLIVVTRFIFSYEQAFMGDLVRFWHGGLFLFASAYTLLEEGHVRVDVLYSGFSQRLRGFVNAFGSICLGIVLCWIILLVGFWGKSNIINSPLLTIEVTQQGFGLYVKYLMAGFLGVYAISMMVQFASTFLDSIADIRGEPGGRKIQDDLIH